MDPSFSAQILIQELAAQIEATVPRGPIRIVGNSIGGHFGYAVALHLQAAGREIAGFCAIDSFMITSSEPSAGWQRRALVNAVDLVRKARFVEFVKLARSKFWRAGLRLAGARVPGLLRKFGASGRLPMAAVDPIFEQEVSMRLLIRASAPWVAALGLDPVPLMVPSALLRTSLTIQDDAAWRRRCPLIEIHEIPGGHNSLFEPEHIEAFRQAFVAATRHWS